MIRTCLMAFVAIAWVALVPTTAALAHSDVEFEYKNGKIEIEPDEHGLIFEGSFPTVGPFARFTTDPGFESEVDAGLGIGAGDIIHYNVLDNLYYWSALTESFADPGSTTITIGNAIGPNTVIGATTGVIKPGGIIGQASGNGNFHAHVSYTLSDGAPFGAYGLLLELETDADGIENSDPFFIVFNYGLSEAMFHEAIEAFEAIPEPSTIVLGIIGGVLLGVAGWRRRRRLRA